jgi:hypothetical protein
MPLLAELRFSNLASSRSGQIAIGVLAGGLLGAALASKLLLAAVLIAAVLSVTAVAMAFAHPGRVFVALVLAMALIPTYAAPAVGSLLFIPAAALCWLIVIALGWRNAMLRGRIFRPTAIDLAVLAFGVLMYISLSYSPQTEFSAFLNDLFAWGGPYLAARLLLEDTRRPAYVLAASFALATAVVAPVALLEAAGKSNPFLHLQFNSVEAAVWAAPASRLGQIRAEASFGHPIGLSMFVSASALLSLGMAIYSSEAKRRKLWLILAALAVGVQALSFSRTGWLMLIVGLALLGMTAASRIARRRIGFVFATIAVAAVALTVTANTPKELQLFPANSASAEGEAFKDSGAYREALLARALQPGVLHLWGNSVNRVTPAVSSTNTATDNAYIILADKWGLIPTLALLTIAAALLIAAALARARKAAELAVLPIVAFTGLCALFFVDFITQQQCMIWLLIGAGSVASERVLVRQRASKAQRLTPIPER